MSSRTKSFFDQNHSSKSRPAQWHRQHHKPPLSESSNNIVPAKPPIPATSQTKSKLKTFQFVPGQPDEAQNATATDEETTESRGSGANKNGDELVAHDESTIEVQNPTAANVTALTENEVSSAKARDDTSAAVPELPKASTFPCTPGARLPLEDLIGNCDENAKPPEPEQTSPEDQIGWIPNSSSNLLTPNRKRKRARSSSPSCADTSSQRQEASAFFTGTAAQAEKKTPDADPSADLWQRYGTGRQADIEPKLPDFIHLMFQASPRPLETPAKSAGLRRWASTGNDWPSNKNKRRRTNGKTSISLWQDEQVTGSGAKSKIAAMVEQLQESLASQKVADPPPKPDVRIDGPSSSSPLPDIGAADGFSGVPAASPLQAKQQVAALRSENLQVLETSSKANRRPVQHKPADSSVDIHMNDNKQSALHDSVISAPLHLQSKAPLLAYKRPSVSRTPSNGAHGVQNIPPPEPAVAAVSEDLDEFGDDLELSAEDLEELVDRPQSLDQRSLHQIPPHPDPPPQQQMNIGEQAAPVHSSNNTLQALQSIQENDFDDEDDEFGCDDIDEATLAQAEIIATQVLRMSPRKRSPRKVKSPKKTFQVKLGNEVKHYIKNLQRYVVKQIIDGEYTNAKGRRCSEKLLLADDEWTSRATAITLRDSWMSTSISQGCIVHVAHIPQNSSNAAPSSPPGQIIISDAESSPLLIVHPDHMLSSTTVADSFDCIRKAVLQDRIKATGETAKPMVYGKILHDIFQQALAANHWDEAFLAELVGRTVQAHAEGLWELGMRDSVLALEEVKAKMGELASWARIFVSESPSEVSLVHDRQGEKIWMSISKLIAIEEHIWSPQFGLKGNIDATVQTTLVDHPREPSKKLIMPFEVKTGRTTQSPAHRAQTALYTLLLSDRYEANVKAGILYYLESSAMSRISPPMNEIRQMVQQRNRLAAYIHRARYPAGCRAEQDVAPQTQKIEDSGLPGLLKNPFKCGKCYAKDSCFAYHALVEQGSAQSAGMVHDGKKDHSQVWREAVGHLQLTAKDQGEAQKLKNWFTKWDRLLTFEESDVSKLRKELWTMNSTEREAAGRCFGNLVIVQDLASTAAPASSSVVDGVEGSGGKINRFTCVFAHSSARPGHSFAEGTQLTVGEPVVVSSESGQWALANGYVIAATKHEITVAVDRRLGNARQRRSDFEDERNQAFRGIMSVGEEQPAAPLTTQPPMLYRLDRDEFSNGLALVRNNLVVLMSSHPIHTKLRKQIIFNSVPAFSKSTATPSLPPSQLGEMNEDQRAAVSKVLNAQDYALILGMPGTGKTTTIAHIIRALLADDKSILLTSFTHTAVDNILLKIRDIATPNSILRLGVPSKINPQVREFCQLAATPRSTIDETEEAYMGSRIVATTCMGTNHALFNRRAFDVCIVDEASQITLPTSLGPLLHARKFVLVGDHYQLPPLVQNKAALEGGLDVSLFRQLSGEHGQAVATLGRQYRMCEDIVSLSNALIYDGRLKCGNDTVARRTLQVANMAGLSVFHSTPGACSTPSRGGKCWIANLAAPERKVIFANTDPIGKAASETLNSGKNITNQVEATLTAQLVVSLLELGVPRKEIGVITLYRSQLALMRQLFKIAGISREVEIDSADRFQGRDKECIVLSMVRSNEAGIVGDLLKDWRRVNVALTRARSKLIMLGSRQTLRCNDLLAKLLVFVDERMWAVELPKDAESCHTFNFSSQTASHLVTQTLSSPAKRKLDRSPPKNAPTFSPGKAMTASPETVLKQSPNNTSHVKNSTPSKRPSKVFSGRGGLAWMKSSKATQQAAIEIFEDFTEDFS